MNKCFLWSTNDQYATPKNIYDQIVSCGYVDFNPLCEDYEDSLLKKFNRSWYWYYNIDELENIINKKYFNRFYYQYCIFDFL